MTGIGGEGAPSLAASPSAAGSRTLHLQHWENLMRRSVLSLLAALVAGTALLTLSAGSASAMPPSDPNGPVCHWVLGQQICTSR